MPRLLLLLRHAKAVSDSPDGDFARVLSARGRRDAARLGAWLRSQKVIPDAALVSPSARARETAQILFQELPQAPRLRLEETLYNASAQTLQTAIAGANGECLILIAHNPGIGELANALGGAEAALILPEGFPTCALAIYESSTTFAGRFRLKACVTPTSLTAGENRSM